MCASIPTVTLVTAMITRSLLCNSANSDSFFEVIMDKTKAQSEKKDEKQPKHKPGEDEKKSPKKGDDHTGTKPGGGAHKEKK